MLPTLLLLFASIAALALCVIMARTKPGAAESPFRQRENAVGCALASLGLAVGAWHRYLDFCQQYERAHDRAFRWEFGPLDLWIYGAFVCGVICFFVWQRRRMGAWEGLREFVWLIALLVLVTLGCFVWPTFWQYRTETPMPDGTLPGPLQDNGQVVTQFRTNRLTGEVQAKRGGHWEHVFEHP